MGAISRGYCLRQFCSPPEVQNFTTHLGSKLRKEMELPGENTWVSCLRSHSAVVEDGPAETGIPEDQMNTWVVPERMKWCLQRKPVLRRSCRWLNSLTVGVICILA